MAYSFIAHIDESGDDGLPGHFRQPGGDGGPSHWFAIGATVWRMSRDLDMVNAAKGIIDQLPPRKRCKSLHFTQLDHAQRVMALGRLADCPFRVTGVFAYKPIIPDGIYVRKNQLYHYMARYLIERLSWLCRDFRRYVPEGDGRVKIVFSRRGGMSYVNFRDYLRLLRAADDPDIQIHWPVIDIEGVEAVDHGQRYGLQLADLAISGLRSALEFDHYGNLEPRFAEMLKDNVYSRNGNFLSYGAKLVPLADRIEAFQKEGVAPANLAHWIRIFGG
ncbi:MAG: DUF3800 domain-containing protein [Bradyrhizobium sp.]|uniref:DUF3800 domain-containing protein n=1 Tax=Bradyrhizobium sp. TaxID=376 RepID=UPI003D0C7F0C